MTEDSSLEAELLFNSIVKEIELDKRTLILMEDHNYNQLYRSLK